MPRLFLLAALLPGCHAWVKEIETPAGAPPMPPQQTGDYPNPTAVREYVRAVLARQAGDTEGALRSVRTALLLDPASPHLRVVLGRLQEEAGDLAGARRSLEEAVLLAPSDPDTLTALGTYLLRSGAPAEARPWLRQATHLGGRDMAWQGRMEADLALGDREAAVTTLADWRKRPPDTLSSLRTRATLALRTGDARAAQDDLGHLLLVQGADGHLLDVYLAASRAAARYRTAMDLLEHLAGPTGGDPDLLQRLALLATEVGERTRAADAWSRYVRSRNARATPALDPTAQAALATALVEAGRPAEAIEALAPLPDDTDALVRFPRARALAALGDPAAALALYPATTGRDLPPSGAAGRKTLPAATTLPEVLFLADLLADQGRRKDALDLLAAARTAFGPLSPLAWAQASHLARAGKLDEAMATLGEVPGEPGEAEWNRARLLAEVGRLDEALARLTRAEAAWPGGTEFLRGQALLLAEAGRLAEARECLETARGRKPDDAEILRLLGWVALQQGRGDDAVRWLRTAAALDPDEPTLKNDLAWALASLDQSLAEAALLAWDAVEVQPGNGAFLDTLGWVYLRQGRTAEALRELTSATRLQPDNPTLLRHLAAAYEAAGRKPDATALQPRIRALESRKKNR